MSDTLYGAAGSGSVPVEAALTLIGRPYRLVEAVTWDTEHPQSGDQVLAANPMRQIPALVLASGEAITESAAILIWLADQHPEARLAPLPGDPARAQFLRWMSFVSAAIYALCWVIDEPSRLVPDPAGHEALKARVQDRVADCWRMMGEQVSPGRFILGDDLTVLDLYVAAVSRFRPRRKRFYAAAPNLEAVVKRVDTEPRLHALWAERMGFHEGWEG